MKSSTMFKDTQAAGAMDMVVGVAIGLIVLVAVFSVAPLIGHKIDSTIEIPSGTAATGVLTVSGVTSDAETVTIEGVTFELDTEGNTSAGRVAVPIADTAAATATVNLTAAINGNATTAALVTATSTATTVNLIADATGTGGNAIDTTEAMGNGTWGAATLTGGTAEGGSPWAGDDVPTGAGMWADNASLLGLVVMVIIIGLAIFYIRNMGGGSAG